MDTFQKFLPIDMGHLSEELYHWVQEWEPTGIEMTLSEMDALWNKAKRLENSK